MLGTQPTHRQALWPRPDTRLWGFLWQDSPRIPGEGESTAGHGRPNKWVVGSSPNHFWEHFCWVQSPALYDELNWDWNHLYGLPTIRPTEYDLGIGPNSLTRHQPVA